MVSFIIILKVKIFLDRPVAELVEQNLSTAISVNFGKFSLWVINWSNPLFDCFFSFTELFEVDSSIATLVDNLECLPVLKPLSQCEKENSELSELDVVSTILTSGNGILGDLECPHNCWFSIKDTLKKEDIADTLVDLSERSVPIPVVIDGAPHFLAGSFLLGVIL